MLLAAALEEFQRIINALADAGIHQDETAVIVSLNVQHPARQCAALLEPTIELALHQAAINLCVRLSQLAGTHPVAKMLHEKLIFVAALVVPTEFTALVAATFVVIKQVAVRPIDSFFVSEWGC